MTKVKFYKNENNFFTKLEVKGHTGFSVHGSDTLCAAISGIVQAGALGIVKVLNINAKIVQDEDAGYLLIELPQDITSNNLEKAQIVFETIYVSLLDLQSGYSKHIKLEVE